MRFLLVVGMFAMAGCQKVDPTPTPAHSGVSRYAIFPSGDRRADYLIDTQSGETWVSRPKPGAMSRRVWVPVPRQNRGPTRQ